MKCNELRILQQVRQIRSERSLAEMNQSNRALKNEESKFTRLQSQFSLSEEQHKQLKSEHLMAMFGKPMLKKQLDHYAHLQQVSKQAVQHKKKAMQQQNRVVENHEEKAVACRQKYHSALKKIEKSAFFLKMENFQRARRERMQEES